MKTWTDLNPGYQHKLLTDELIAGYVRDHFHASNPDIEETFLQAKDLVLQLDLIKYLVLWDEGGVYSGLDVACVQPVSHWVPPQFIDKAGIVLGVQMEQKAERDGNAMDNFQLADWTIMSKPNQPFLCFLYQQLTENIKHLAAEQIVPASNSRPYNISDVTGRNALTQAFLAYATSVTAAKVTVNNFTKFNESKLFGEILVLPVQAFAFSHRNGKELVHHYEAGSWKAEPWDKLQPEEQKEKEPEENDVVGEEKNVEAEKQKQEDIETTGGDQNPEESKASPAHGKKPTSDKPPSVQYENVNVAENATDTKHNTSTSTMQHQAHNNTNTNTKAQTLPLSQEQQSAAAAAITSQIATAHKKAKEAEKKKEEEEEERIAEEMKKPQWAPLKEKGELKSSTNLKDYGEEFVGGD